LQKAINVTILLSRLDEWISHDKRPVLLLDACPWLEQISYTIMCQTLGLELCVARIAHYYFIILHNEEMLSSLPGSPLLWLSGRGYLLLESPDDRLLLLDLKKTFCSQIFFHVADRILTPC